MNQQEMIEAAAGELTLGLDGAAQYVHDWIASHPDAALQTLCKQVADKAGVTDSWNALRVRVQRKQQNGSDQAEVGRTSTQSDKAAVRHARRVLRNAEPEQIADLIEDPEVRQNLAAAGKVHEYRQENRTGIPARNPSSGPTFIATVLKVNGWLDELVGMVERGEAQIPPEFSTQSLSDIGVKAMRLKELVDNVRQGEEVLS